MVPARVVGAEGAPHRTRRQARDGAPLALPQPGLRLMGIASLGIGTGLSSASVPPEVLALAFAPALIALVVVAVRSTFAGPASYGPESEEIRHG